MKSLLWFILGLVVAIAGETAAQQWGGSQQSTDALNNLNNNSNYQRQQSDQQRFGTYSNPYAKPPC